MKIDGYFEKRSPQFIYLAGALLLVLIALLDYFTGPELSFVIFYIVPIFMVARYRGLGGGMGAALLSSGVWFGIYVYCQGGIESTVIEYSNLFEKLGFFLFFAGFIASLKKTLEYERTVARIDHLTGLNNARYFYEIAATELARARRSKRDFTVVYLDVDNFKHINDTLGHNAGDQLLQSITKTVKVYLRSTDIIARLGGDEFVFMLPETDFRQSEIILKRIQTRLLEKMQKDDMPITFSLGMVTFVDQPESVTEMVKIADELMYAVKNSGKNGIKHINYFRTA